MQAKTHALATTAVRLDLNVNSERTKDIKMDVKEISPCFYPDIISNNELQRRTSSSRKEDGDGPPTIAHQWTPDSRRKRGYSKETWRRTIGKKIRDEGQTRRQLYQLATEKKPYGVL